MTGYQYGDPGDQMAAKLIEISDGNDTNWQNQDVELVRSALALASTGVGSASIDSADVGAGTGRMIPVLLDSSRSVVAVEPDHTRFTALGKLVASLGEALAARVDCRQGSLEQLTGLHFDFVLVSHVVQHLSSIDRLAFLREVACLGRSGGALLVTYSSTGDAQTSRHYLSTSEGGVYATTEIDPETFDDVAASGGSQSLPVWHSSLSEVPELLEALGLSIRGAGPYRWFNHETVMTDGRTVRSRAADAYSLAVFR